MDTQPNYHLTVKVEERSFQIRKASKVSCLFSQEAAGDGSFHQNEGTNHKRGRHGEQEIENGYVRGKGNSQGHGEESIKITVSCG